MAVSVKQKRVTVCALGLIIAAAYALLSFFGAESYRQIQLCELTAEELTRGEQRFTLELPVDQPLHYTRILSSEPVETYPAMEGEAPPALELAVSEGRLIARVPQEKVSALRCGAELTATLHRRQPDATVHTLRHVLLSCEQETAGGKRVYLLQVELDLAAGTADLVPCTTPARYHELYARDYQSIETSGLPEKINGEPLRRDMLTILYTLAAIENHRQAELICEPLFAFAYRLGQKAPQPKEPWPRTWGDAQDDAREVARRLTPVLVYLQEHNCFDCAKLADFINSPIFGAIFGNRFTSMPGERVQEQPIEYVPMLEHE